MCFVCCLLWFVVGFRVSTVSLVYGFSVFSFGQDFIRPDVFVWVLKASSLEFSETDKESLILWV